MRKTASDPTATVLDLLERSLLVRSRALQRIVLDRHRRAFKALLPTLAALPHRTIGVVGGGLYPRTALALKRLLPESRIVILDAKPENLEIARGFLERAHETGIELLAGWFDPAVPSRFDLLVIPLALRGNREQLYRRPPAPVVLVHDWIWNARGDETAVISAWMLKRLNLVLAERRAS
jgi:hypothetical protein